MNIPLDSIRIDGGTQPRLAIDTATVTAYADDMAGGATFPPVTVFFDGASNWLADGFHRFHAARSLRLGEISADVRTGTQRDAVLFSLGANGTHGQRRTNEDKRRAVGIALADPEWSKNSDRWIAEACGVGHAFVSKLRPQVSTVDTCGNSPQRVGQDGKNYPTPETKRARPRLSDAERARLLAMSDDPKDDVSEDSVSAKPTKRERRDVGPPSNGMQFARIAIMQMEEITEDDAERKEAFEYVAAWIKGQQ